MVKYLLGLNDSPKREFDAEKAGEYFEIKATSSGLGTTTMNFDSKPDILVWIKFDFENSNFEIKRFDNFNSINRMEEFYTEEALDRRHEGAKNLFESKSRETVILKNVRWHNSVTYTIHSVIEADEE